MAPGQMSEPCAHWGEGHTNGVLRPIRLCCGRDHLLDTYCWSNPQSLRNRTQDCWAGLLWDGRLASWHLPAPCPLPPQLLVALAHVESRILHTMGGYGRARPGPALIQRITQCCTDHVDWEIFGLSIGLHLLILRSTAASLQDPTGLFTVRYIYSAAPTRRECP